MTSPTYVIVGGSLTGATAAAALRKQGFDGRVVLIGEEPQRPYERPDLSKKYLRGEPDAHVYVHRPELYSEQGIELLTGVTVERIDVHGRRVVTASGSFGYDRLLLATGSSPRRPDIPGADLDGVVTLRTIGDADRIRDRALNSEHVVVVGGGWIGSEVAASLRQLGRSVTLVVPGGAPLERVLGPDVAAVYADAHRRHGVTLLSGTRVVRFVGSDTVRAVDTDDGRTTPADLVVVGIGAEPRTELATAAGLAVDDGILVDERLETSVAGIHAAGDVANALHARFGRRVRVEHWDNAKRQGRHAAGAMLGEPKPYERIPYFYSDQYELSMEYTGFAPSWDEVVFRGDPASGAFVAFWLRDGTVAAGMNVNVDKVAPAIDRLVASGARIDRARLTDEDQPLEALAEAETAPA